ncbi:MAG TPA: carbonate dehydratase [Rhodothermales bacterium]|nr:carbonate dehydratase [Rhodothermales bacterium]
MQYLKHLFDNNRSWVEKTLGRDPEFFENLTHQQTPQYLWIGCADSRVPANQIVGLMPGELFVHRNVANLVVPGDLNCLSVIQFAVEVLDVKHIIVCGHYRCGGVHAALNDQQFGLIDAWLRHIVDIKRKHVKLLDAETGMERRSDLLSELNVLEQVGNVCRTSIVLDAWRRGQELKIHGWVYDVGDGLLQDLGFTVGGEDEIESAARNALERVSDRRSSRTDRPPERSDGPR